MFNSLISNLEPGRPIEKKAGTTWFTMFLCGLYTAILCSNYLASNQVAKLATDYAIHHVFGYVLFPQKNCTFFILSYS